MRTNLTKALGISLLAIVGVLAVNASAAHATWTLLKNASPAPNNLLNLNAELLETEFLFFGSAFKVKCTNGRGNVHLQGGAALLWKTNTIEFKGCKALDFSKCEVHSAGSPVGTITTVLEGEGSLSGTSVQALAKNEVGFTEIVVVENELCPFNETEEKVTGSLTLLILSAATLFLNHLAHLNEEELKFDESEEEVFIDGLEGTKTTDTALLHLMEISDATWAIDHS
jgi:hypothetical protein